MKIVKDRKELQEPGLFEQLSEPVAVTSPLEIRSRVMVGLYSDDSGSIVADLSRNDFEAVKRQLYEPQRNRAVLHGAKRTWESVGLGGQGTRTDLIADTELTAWILDSGRPESDYSLSRLAERYLGYQYPWWTRWMLDHDSPESVQLCLSNDAHVIHGLGRELLSRLDQDQRFLLFYGELPVVIALLDMTRRGIPVDGAAATHVLGATQASMDRLASEIAGDRECSLWNGRQVYSLLRAKQIQIRNPQIYRRGEISNDELKNLAHEHPLAQKILDWRDLTTDLAFLKAAAGKSRVHPTWNLMTRTARITASKPAVQNASKLTCRPLIKAPAGWIIIKADYRQIQMRILASLSVDPALVAVFRTGQDIHTLTAELCGLGGPDKESRDRAKAVNYGILFQMTARGLSRELSCTYREAQAYIDAFWQRYSGAKQFLDDFVRELEQKPSGERTVRSYLGRIRRFDGAFGAREQRQAKATLLQQMEADILRMAVMRLYASFRDQGMRSRICMVIHDAVYVETPFEEADQVRAEMKTIMEDAVELPVVPLEVDFE